MGKWRCTSCKLFFSAGTRKLVRVDGKMELNTSVILEQEY